MEDGGGYHGRWRWTLNANEQLWLCVACAEVVFRIVLAGEAQDSAWILNQFVITDQTTANNLVPFDLYRWNRVKKRPYFSPPRARFLSLPVDSCSAFFVRHRWRRKTDLRRGHHVHSERVEGHARCVGGCFR